MWAFAVFSTQLKRRHASRIAQEGEIDQFIHGLEIEACFFGLGIQMQVAGINLRDRSINPPLSLRQLQLRIAHGVQVLLDTSGKDVALRRAIDAMATGGRLGIVTVPDWGKDYRLPIQPLFERFGSLVSIIQGSSIPATFLPYLIEQYRAGRFPFDRLVTAYPFAQINQAVEDARRGQAVKPVLLMP